MEEDKFGVPRPFIEDGKGPFGMDRPFAQGAIERLEAELESAIDDEKGANSEYERLESMLRRMGMDSEAKIVSTIREQEMKHQKQLRNILSKVRRKTS